MLHYKHVLIATDLTQGSKKVANHAKFIADQSEAKLSIVHVVEHAPSIYGSGQFSHALDINLEEQIRSQANEAMIEIAELVGIPGSERHLKQGTPKEGVLETANALNADLIVVGTHGRKGLKVLLGSTSNAILHSASCDVLVVHLEPED